MEADSPEQYVRDNSRYPILDITVKPDGDTIVTTGDQAGNIIRYTFTN